MKICYRINMMYLLIVFLGLQSPLQGFSQEIDSLMSMVATQANDTTKALQLIKLAELLQHNNPLLADSISQEALRLSRQLAFEKGVNYSLSNLGSLSITRGKYPEAERYNQQLMNLAMEANNLEAKIKALNRASVIYYYTGEYQKGIETNIEILELLHEQPEHDSRLYALNNIGINYERLNDPPKALEYYLQALKMAVDLEQEYAEAAIAGNIGIIYKNLNQLDTARQLFLQGIEAAMQINNINLLIDETANLAEVFLLQNEIDSAEKYIKQSLDFANEIGDQNGILKAYNLQGRCFTHRGQYRKAIDALQFSAMLSDSLGDREIMLNTYHHLQENYIQLENTDSAYHFLQLYANMKDSVFNLEKNRQLNELEAKFQTAQKSAEIARQQVEIQHRNNQRKQLMVVIAFLLLLGGTIVFVLNFRLNKNKELARKDHLLQEQKINHLEQEKKILSMTSMIDGQESERIRIAKDLHDGIGGLLTSVRTQIKKIEKEVTLLSEFDLYKKTNQLIDEATNEVKRISQNLMPGVLRLEGLPVAMEDICARLGEVHGLKVESHFDPLIESLSETQQTFIYRIFQELTNNIVKHAHATEVLIQLNQYRDHLNLIIEDNGIGFETAQAKSNEGLGLKSVQSRIDFLGGEMELVTKKDEGTSISINIPMKEKKEI